MTNDSTSAQAAEHVYYEIGSDLLSKPNALAQIIEGAGSPPTLIFCNTPSDTDLVVVLLKKRGVSATKLIGNVPQPKLERAIEQLKKGEVTALVVTDIAARGLEIDDFELMIHYSANSDPEVYLSRISKPAPYEKLRKIISLIGPLDITHFHYLKKIADFPLEKAELPSAEDIGKARVEKLYRQASGKAEIGEERIQTLTDAILKHAHKKEIVSLLLHNTLDVIPSLIVAAEREEGQFDDDDGGDDFDDMPRYDNRGGNRSGGGGRRDRDNRHGGGGGGRHQRGGGGRGGRHDSYDNRGGGRMQGLPRTDEDGELISDDSYGQHDRHGGGRDRDGGGHHRGDRGDRGDRGPRHQRPMIPPTKDARIYVGQGTQDGVSEDKMKELIQSTAGLDPTVLKRFTGRKCYSFFDVPEEHADTLLSSLNDKSLDSGSKLFLKRAITITGLRSEQRMEQGGEETPQQEDQAPSTDDSSYM